MRIRQLIVIGLGAGVYALAPPTSAQEPAPVPLAQEPRHHVVYESPSVRLHDIQVPPGDTTLFHTHTTAILYVPISRSTTRSQPHGGEWSSHPAAGATPPAAQPSGPGRVNSVTTYVEKPYTHRLNNLGPTTYRLFGIANLTAGANGAADDISKLSVKPELENNWYRAHRVVIKPGESSAPHTHAVPVVIVMQTAGTVASESPAWQPINGPGDYAWHTGTGTHVLHNRGVVEVELVEVEVRGARP